MGWAVVEEGDASACMAAARVRLRDVGEEDGSAVDIYCERRASVCGAVSLSRRGRGCVEEGDGKGRRGERPLGPVGNGEKAHGRGEILIWEYKIIK